MVDISFGVGVFCFGVGFLFYYEVGMGFLYDLFFRADVFLLFCIYNVVFFENFYGKRFGFFIF